MVQFTLFLHKVTDIKNVIPWLGETVQEFSDLFTNIKTIVTNNVCFFWGGGGSWQIIWH